MKSSFISKLLFIFFFISGFCSLLYQVVWTRLAYASFGINTPVLSVVLSVFMAGLALGSWWGGRWVSRREERSQPALFLRLYGLAELGIGLGAFLVPALFSAGEKFLLPLGAMDSTGYLFFSALVILVSLLPWCICMGATFPLMMAYLSRGQKASQSSFSFLYTANVLGALAGTIVTALVLIEVLGFRGTLVSAAGLNFALSLASLALSGRDWTPGLSPLPLIAFEGPAEEAALPLLPLLFLTGFCSMALEVVWTRAFTVILKTQVYSFAALLGTYLLSTYLGSLLYRRHLRKGSPVSPHTLVGLAFASACLTAAVNDFRIHASIAGVLGSIAPLCACLGYLTPGLIDRFSLGRPGEAGRAYAVNVLGCILGPLAASYLLLPGWGAKDSMLILAVPLGLFFLFGFSRAGEQKPLNLLSAGLALGLAALSLFWTVGYEEGLALGNSHRVLRRDYAATVIACGQGMEKKLYVNGIGLTVLAQDTKMMAHLPLAFLPAPPRSALDICFGMGTTFRSLSSWGIRVTAVELVPSVLKSFGFYFEDAEKVLSSPRVNLVVDDGNRFLHRTSETFDVITIDPPPPLEAAGSSLLHATEFYECAKSHLNPGGILQQWLVTGEIRTDQAAARSISKVFPYVRAFSSPDGVGYHLLASSSPIPRLTMAQLLQKIPAPALRDLMEWYPGLKPDTLIRVLLSREMYFSALLNPDRSIEITNDRPFNEYFLLRKWKRSPGST